MEKIGHLQKKINVLNLVKHLVQSLTIEKIISHKTNIRPFSRQQSSGPLLAKPFVNLSYSPEMTDDLTAGVVGL